jgi:hypothetical protein
MRYLIPLLLALLCVPPLLLGIVGMIFTYKKLEKMEQIHGWKPGAIVKVETIHQKFEDPHSGVCWIAFSDENIRRGGPHRMNLQPDVWQRYAVGEHIEIVYVPGDPTPYARDGIFASDGNFAFDRGIVMVEAAMIVLSVLGIVVSLGILVVMRLLAPRKVTPDPSVPNAHT